MSAITSNRASAAARSSAGPLTTSQLNFICGSPATFDSPLNVNVSTPSWPASVPIRAASGP